MLDCLKAGRSLTRDRFAADEDIFATIFGLNKAETVLVVECFYGSGGSAGDLHKLFICQLCEFFFNVLTSSFNAFNSSFVFIFIKPPNLSAFV